MKPDITLKGIYRDRLIDGTGAVVHDSGWTPNTIVTNGRVLLAGFIKQDAVLGLQHLAVGEGLAAWDTDGPPPPTEAETGLVSPFAALIAFADLKVVYLNASDEPIAEASSRLQITATLDPGYPTPPDGETTYPLREFGLFGDFEGSAFMINNVRHPVIHKDESATLIRVIRLYF